MTRLYLVRHGEHGLLGQVLAGRMPGVPLSEAGRAQAEALARFFAGRSDIATLASSPMQRCRETAAAIARRLGLEVRDDAALDEIDCGDWTGVRFDALASDPRWAAWNRERCNTGAPGGETAQAVQARIMRLVGDMAERGDAAALVVTHSDVIKTVVLTLLGSSLDRHDGLEIEPASVTTVDLWPQGGRLVRSNEIVT